MQVIQPAASITLAFQGHAPGYWHSHTNRPEFFRDQRHGAKLPLATSV